MSIGIDFLSDLGTTSIALLWIPLLIWTGISILVLGFMQLSAGVLAYACNQLSPVL